MVASLILCLMLPGHLAQTQAATGGQIWEETVIAQQKPGYRPMLRFNTQSTMIRFSPASNYMFVTPGFIQQGQFQTDDGKFSFRAVSANELERADIAKLAAGMEPPAAKALVGKYTISMDDFDGVYDPSDGSLTVEYRVGGALQHFALHLTTEGDDQLPLLVPDTSAGFIGLWYAPEPFPDKLDARTRTKIELDGLQRFFDEAGASNAAQFGILDLRRNATFRMHGIVGTWSRSNSILRLNVKGQKTDFTISADGAKLLLGGKPVFVRR